MFGFAFGQDIGIDLGTASILVYIKGKGVVLKEPSVVAFDRDTNKIKAIGEEARLMLGRTPGNIVAVRPLRQGVISDYRVTEQMMKVCFSIRVASTQERQRTVWIGRLSQDLLRHLSPIRITLISPWSRKITKCLSLIWICPRYRR